MQILKNKYFTNTYWLIAEKILRLVNAIIISAIVTRYLGAKNVGILNYSSSFVIMFGAFGSLGIDALIVQYLVKNEDRTNSILGTTFLLKLIGGAVACALIYLTTIALKIDETTKTYVYIVSSILIINSLNILDFYFQAKVQSRKNVIAKLLALVLITFLKLYFVYVQENLLYFIILLPLEIIVINTVIFIYYKNDIRGSLKWSIDLDFLKELTKDAWPLFMAALAVSTYMKIDHIMLKELTNFKELGLYSSAVKLTEIWSLFPIVITSSFYPSIVKAYRDQTNYKLKLQLLYDGMFLFALSLSSATFFVSEHVISILYGPEFSASAGVLSIHIWSTLFIFIGVCNANWFLLKNQYKITLFVTILSLTSNIVLNYIFIPQWGIKGAAAATVISSSVSSIWGMFFFYSRCKENIKLTFNAFLIHKSIVRLLEFKKNFSN